MRTVSILAVLGGSLVPVMLLAALPAQAVEAAYRCANGTRLTATFSNVSGKGAVALAMRGTAITLPQVMSADGGRYATGSREFWIKGREATYTNGGKTTTCKTSN